MHVRRNTSAGGTLSSVVSSLSTHSGNVLLTWPRRFSRRIVVVESAQQTNFAFEGGHSNLNFVDFVAKVSFLDRWCLAPANKVTRRSEMKGVFSVKASRPDALRRCAKAASAAHFLTVAAVFRSGHSVSRWAVESRMSDGAEFTRANIGEDRPQKRCDDVDRWIGADNEQKIGNDRVEELIPEDDDDGVVEFPDREEDWHNMSVDEPSHSAN